MHRFEAGIAELAEALRAGDVARAQAALRAGLDGVVFVEPVGEWPAGAELEPVRADAVTAGVRMSRAARDGDAASALAALDGHRLLLAHRRGPAGVARWTEQVADWVAAAAGAEDTEAWYARSGPSPRTLTMRHSGSTLSTVDINDSQ